MRDSGRTVVLVTHDMTAVQSYCHRAMLLDEGELRFLGDPEEAGRQYLRMNFAKRTITIGGDREVAMVPDFLARVSEAWLEDEGGERIDERRGRASRSGCRRVIEARQDLAQPGLRGPGATTPTACRSSGSTRSSRAGMRRHLHGGRTAPDQRHASRTR